MRKRLATIGIVVVLVVAVVVLTSHRGGRAYFSPHTLEYLTQTERTIFATGIPFYRSRLERVENPVVAMLIEDGFVSRQPDKNGHWELIFHWNEAWHDGYGQLYDIFSRHRDAIVDWSRKNPECAKIYWSEGFRLLRSDNPEDVIAGGYLLRECWRIDDPEEMRKTIQLKYSRPTWLRDLH
jgi:hypothetical protein